MPEQTTGEGEATVPESGIDSQNNKALVVPDLAPRIESEEQAVDEIRELLDRGKLASLRLDRIRYVPQRQKLDAINEIRENPIWMEQMLRAWDHANKEYFRYDTNLDLQRQHPGAVERWDTLGFDMYKSFDHFLREDVNEDFFSPPDPNTVTSPDRPGYAVVRQFAQDADFPAHYELSRILSYDLWLAWTIREQNRNSVTGEEGPSFARAHREFEEKSRQIIPLLRDSMAVAAQKEDTRSAGTRCRSPRSRPFKTCTVKRRSPTRQWSFREITGSQSISRAILIASSTRSHRSKCA